jgi:S-DNA-T family DNA segregation ATPase FtsK/SpoIIIE
MGEASINKISKEFKIGFNRAQKIVESLSDIGIVSDNVGSKARNVLVNSAELEEVLNEN